MKKWSTETFQHNHLRLMKCHLWFVAFWLAVAFGGAAYVFRDRGGISSELISFSAFYSIPALMHGLLAYGSFNKIELSRRASEVVFALLLVVFPVGTFLSMFIFLPATQWKIPTPKEK
jgi:hypothetical protein